MTDIILAKSAGFCFGVRRAVEEAEILAGDSNDIINTYGELIHNPQEVSRLSRKGLIAAHDIESLKSKKVIIRTHGVSKRIIEDLTEKGHEIIDLTCPFVKKIHKIANNACNEGIKTVIIGNGAHPEVQGICGWCNGNFLVVSSEEDVEKVPEQGKISIVAQTTLDRATWDRLYNMVISRNPDYILNDTICSATATRQKEAAELASRVDAMIIVGGRSSSNTKKLYDVAKKLCENTFHIEQASELNLTELAKFHTIGITAGASTPDHIIKEVFITMENIKSQDELNFEAMLDESLKTLNTGDTVKGIVVDIKPNEVILELVGCKYNGIIDLDNLATDTSLTPSDVVSKGEEIEAFVIQVDDGNGQVRLSRRKLEQEKSWQKAQDAFNAGEILTGKIVEILQNGVVAVCDGLRMFIPASQASERYMADLSELKGQELPMRIIDITEGRRRRIVASIKSVLKEESQKVREAFWADVAEGKEYEGTVKSITPFGVFVDIGGVDGLVHVSELSWKRIANPAQVVKVGDTLNVYVKALDTEKKKISLSCKKEEDNPWTKFMATYKIGDIATGTVVRLVPFGAFVDIGGVDGLIHISEISWRRINHPSEVLSEGQSVEVFIKEIDEEKQKIALGYKRIEDNPWEIFKSKYSVGDTVKCKVLRIAAFGAFAEIVEGVDGLIHISQISNNHIASVAEALQPGTEVEAKIVEIKEEEGKVSLSIRALLEEAAPAEKPEAEAETEEFADVPEGTPVYSTETAAEEEVVEAAEEVVEAAEEVAETAEDAE